MTRHRLADLLDEAARGRFPPADGRVEVLPAPPGSAMAVVAFTGHHVVAADVDPDWVARRLPDGDLLAPMSPAFIADLGAELHRRGDGLDLVLAVPGLDGTPALTEVQSGAHPRVVRAHAHRAAVRAFADVTGTAVVVLGHSAALRAEVAIEVDAAARGRGVASAALTEARRLVGADGVLFAQVAPGNAASLRAFLAAGFRPVGSEVLFF